MDSEIPPSVKIEQPEVYLDWLGSMKSHSLLPSNNIKLEPASETDCVNSSANEILTKIQVIDKMNSKIPPSVKIEQHEIYLDYQEIYPSSQIYPAISNQEHSHVGMYPTIDLKFVEQELSDALYEDRSHRFSKMVDMEGAGIIQEMAGHNNTNFRMNENGYTSSINQENCSQMSENMSSVNEINEKPSLANDNFQFHNVETIVRHTHPKPLDCTVDFASCIPHRIQTPHISDRCDPIVNINRYIIRFKRTEEKPYRCDDCGTSFADAGSLKEHKRTHDGEQLHKCGVCGAAFTQAPHLKIHKRTHTGEKPYKCHICGASFSEAGKLMVHKRTHTGEKPYKYDVCGAAFTQADNLKIHKRTHTGEKPYICDVCGTSFAQNSNLKIHKRTHTGEKRYQCDVCGTCFAETGTLKRHKRTHTGEKPFTCDICGSSFTRGGSLKQHKRIHTGEKPYKCDVCNAYFTKVGTLKRHERTHRGEKPYKCDVCGASFSEAGRLKRHERTHTGERPYKCDVCGATFTQTGNLKKHKRTHTG